MNHPYLYQTQRPYIDRGRKLYVLFQKKKSMVYIVENKSNAGGLLSAGLFREVAITNYIM